MLLLGLLLICWFPSGCLFFGTRVLLVVSAHQLTSQDLGERSSQLEVCCVHIQGCPVANPGTPTLMVLNLQKIKHLSRHKRLNSPLFHSDTVNRDSPRHSKPA